MESRVAVTGAASGIGREVVRTSDAAGGIVAALDVNERGLTDLAAETQCVPLRCDVTDEASVHAAFAAIAANVGGLDIVVSNAGSAPQGAIGDISSPSQGQLRTQLLRTRTRGAGSPPAVSQRWKRRPYVVQHLQSVGESGTSFRLVWDPKGRRSRAHEAICSRSWRRRHSRQRRKRRARPHRSHGRSAHRATGAGAGIRSRNTCPEIC